MPLSLLLALLVSQGADTSGVETPGEVFRLYRPNYLLFGDLAGQVKFQISFEYGLVGLGDRASLSFTYTQRSFWALYLLSAPFRETNYLPGVIARYVLTPCFVPVRSALEFGAPGYESRLRDARVGCSRLSSGFMLDYVGAGIEHESNGTALPNSRSWNILFGEISFEWANRSVEPSHGDSVLGIPAGPFIRLTPRVWLPFLVLDTNADITDFVGYGSLKVELGTGRTGWGRFVLELLGRKGVGFTSAGSLQTSLFWQPWEDGFRPWFDLQWWLGYDERLIRYNVPDNLLRFGVGFRE